MNDRDKHLSLALDALTELRADFDAMPARELWGRWYRLLDAASGHIEAATEMPKPSRIRTFVQRIREAA